MIGISENRIKLGNYIYSEFRFHCVRPSAHPRCYLILGTLDPKHYNVLSLIPAIICIYLCANLVHSFKEIQQYINLVNEANLFECSMHLRIHFIKPKLLLLMARFRCKRKMGH